ncbi:peptidoglycan DD-metalloendopeptidase family protein [Longispora sp. K20-0274]|uniref:M23 family metallopeptidase n=1 Tax=Longispora sp. K20-0274 TaxID=3088255 RepID=UPI00399B9F0D
MAERRGPRASVRRWTLGVATTLALAVGLAPTAGWADPAVGDAATPAPVEPQPADPAAPDAATGPATGQPATPAGTGQSGATDPATGQPGTAGPTPADAAPTSTATAPAGQSATPGTGTEPSQAPETRAAADPTPAATDPAPAGTPAPTPAADPTPAAPDPSPSPTPPPGQGAPTAPPTAGPQPSSTPNATPAPSPTAGPTPSPSGTPGPTPTPPSPTPTVPTTPVPPTTPSEPEPAPPRPTLPRPAPPLVPAQPPLAQGATAAQLALEAAIRAADEARTEAATAAQVAATDAAAVSTAEAAVTDSRAARDALRAEFNTEISRLYQGPAYRDLRQFAPSDTSVRKSSELAGKLTAAEDRLAADEAALAAAKDRAVLSAATAKSAEDRRVAADAKVQLLRAEAGRQPAPVVTTAVPFTLCQAAAPAGSKLGLSPAQSANAATIVAVGRRLGVPEKGLVVAIATAMQESSLRNLANVAYPESLSMANQGVGYDHDSLGLFQQRPATGWGTPGEVMNPEYAAEKFYRSLLKVPGWQDLPVTMAAQVVQRSAFPDAYARHEAPAAQLVAGLAGVECATGAWVAPVTASITSGYMQPARPDHHGVDLGAARGTQIRVAAAGIVRTAACDATAGGRDYGCDTDGSVAVTGCGWYVDVEHADGVVTRYCHMLRRPEVNVGDQVAAGQVLGQVGTSGNSSGPHLHFEVHLGGGRDNASTTDPVEWLRGHGVPLS